MADAGRSRRAPTIADDGAGAGAGAGRGLSDLSDDLLRRILFLAPDREGASTAVLSRRWRWLWRTSGAVYLDYRSFIGGCSSLEQEREALLRGAEKALAAAAAAGPIRRLTFLDAENSNINLPMRHVAAGSNSDNLIAAVVSNPAARRVEELRIEVTQGKLSFASLPYEALRVLRIIGCSCSAPTAVPPLGAAAAFPMLADLHLQNCSVPLVDLQRIIDAAPRLSALHLASSHLSTDQTTMHGVEQDQDQVVRLLIPGVSAIVLADCPFGSYYRYKTSFELDAPRLQCFRYRGAVQQTNRLSLKSSSSQASADMVDVDLQLTHDSSAYMNSPTPPAEVFWRFIQNFSTTKLLKLRMDYFTVNDLALLDMASRDELLDGLSFSRLEQLELEAEYDPGFQISMVMLADLLRCCPVLRDLRIKLLNKHRTSGMWDSVDNVTGVQFDRSVSGFRNRSRRHRSASMVSLDRENDDYDYQAYYGINDLTSEHAFSCLQSHLKRVSLDFFMDDPNCLGVQLAKFFAENAMVLQEMHINDGSQEMLEHVNSSVRGWIGNTDKTAITN